MTEAALPAAFDELEPYLAWALPTEAERMAKRVASPMEEIIAFHSAVSPCMEEIITYLNQYPYTDLPQDARTLSEMALSLVEISALVEMYKDPARLYMVDADRFVPIE
jgi:hypothetical protein